MPADTLLHWEGQLRGSGFPLCTAAFGRVGKDSGGDDAAGSMVVSRCIAWVYGRVEQLIRWTAQDWSRTSTRIIPTSPSS